jgi:apolipoprotein N-acyltransferase
LTPRFRWALAGLSGVLLALSFPKFGHGAVGLLALAPLFIALSGTRPFQGFCLGFVTGVISSLGLVYWTALVVTQFGGMPLAVGVAVMVLLCLVLGLFPAAVGAAVARLGLTVGPAAVLFGPLFWVAIEMVRMHTFFRFPWCLLGYTQAERPELVQLAAIGGVHLVSLFVGMVSALFAFGAVAESARGRRIALSAAPLLVLAVWGFGAWRLSRPWAELGRFRVGLVQASIAQDLKWEPSLAWDHVGRHLHLSDEAASRGAKLVVWPESSLPFSFDGHAPAASLMRQAARARGVYLVFGNDDRRLATDGRELFHVGAKMLTPDGELALRYHKMHLVPFGEYVPMQSLLTLGGRFSARLVSAVSDFSPGEEAVVGRVGEHPLGVSICYEDIFPSLSRQFVRNGAELLVNITNDGWYGRTSAPYQHLAMARLRAVETGRYLVRSANTGITAVIDPRGRVVAETSLFERTALVADVGWSREVTPYVAFGDVVGWACVGLTLILAGWPARRRSGSS